MERQIIFGTSVLENHPPKIDNAVISYPGFASGGYKGFSIDEDLQSRHILMLGGSGCGKTNAFLFTLDALRKNMRQNDVAIIFDTKGEFYDMFSKEGDYVIGNSEKFRSISHTWNLFDEILADGEDEGSVSVNAREIAAALFHGRGSSSQPFFCNAARDIFRGILVHFIRMAEKNPTQWKNRLNHEELMKAIGQFTAQDYVHIFSSYPDLKGLCTYIGDGNSGQALGVFGELNSMLSEYFFGIFAKHRSEKSVSMRTAVRERCGRAVFVEYDLSVGETLTPIYRLLIDQALKEALGRNKKHGNVFLLADEFKLLPKLQHIDDALNFGRGLGVKVMAGIQSIDQLYDIYGKEKGAVIAGGFGSLFAFHTNDASSREYITKRFGSNIMVYEYADRQHNRIVTNERNGNTVEDWEQLQLGLGQAVVGLGYEYPFLFQFEQFLTALPGGRKI